MRSWMKLIVVALVILGGPFANAEGPGHDYPPFVAVEGFQRTTFTEHRFDKAAFLSDDKGTQTTIAGHYFYIGYRLNDPTAGSDPYLLSSFQEQLESFKRKIQKVEVLNKTDRCYGTVDFASYNAVLTVRFQKGNTPVWVAVSCNSGIGYGVTVVEEQAFHH